MWAQLPIAERWQAPMMWEAAQQGNTQGKSKTVLSGGQHEQKPKTTYFPWKKSCFWRTFDLTKNKMYNIDISCNMSDLFSCPLDFLCTAKHFLILYILYIQIMKPSFSTEPFIIDINVLNQWDHISFPFHGLGNGVKEIKWLVMQARSAVTKSWTELKFHLP